MHDPLITEIQRFSLQDGPGIRTTLFVKGCPLSCPWCHNPEGRNPKPELYFFADRCRKCLGCVAVCENDAALVETGRDGQPVVNLDRTHCIACLRCIAACVHGAREAVGRRLSMGDIVRELEADRPFFDSSGGGVTISGGEPLMFPEFTLRLSRTLKLRGLTVALETSGYAKWETLQMLLENIDLFIVDLKTLDPQKYQTTIGCRLQNVQDNIEGLIDHGARVRLHIPVIPGFNDTADDFQSFAAYIERFSARLSGVDILPYHCYGVGKYTHLGIAATYVYNGVEDLKSSAVVPLALLLKNKGVPEVTIGGIGHAAKSSGCRTIGQAMESDTKGSSEYA